MRNAAREVLALTQYKAGKLDDAMKNFQAILDDPAASRDTQGRVQIYMLQLQAEGAKPIMPPADTTSSAPASASSAPAASSDATADASATPSAAVDASTELDVTPPIVDTSAMSMVLPQETPAAPEASSEALPPGMPSAPVSFEPSPAP
jgi:hypothetical protein